LLQRMAKRPAQSLVALSRQIENAGIAAFICPPSLARTRGEASDQQRLGIRPTEARAIEMLRVAARQK
jgi:non-ribosomal peptide synthetase component F